MKTIALLICLIPAALSPFGSPAAAETVAERLLACAGVSDRDHRLSCYDSLMSSSVESTRSEASVGRLATEPRTQETTPSSRFAGWYFGVNASYDFQVDQQLDERKHIGQQFLTGPAAGAFVGFNRVSSDGMLIGGEFGIHRGFATGDTAQMDGDCVQLQIDCLPPEFFTFDRTWAAEASTRVGIEVARDWLGYGRLGVGVQMAEGSHTVVDNFLPVTWRTDTETVFEPFVVVGLGLEHQMSDLFLRSELDLRVFSGALTDDFMTHQSFFVPTADLAIGRRF